MLGAEDAVPKTWCRNGAEMVRKRYGNSAEIVQFLGEDFGRGCAGDLVELDGCPRPGYALASETMSASE